MANTESLSDYAAGEIRATLARRRITGKDLAAKLEVSRSWVSYRLTGTTEITLNDLQRIADALDLEIVDLLPQKTRGERTTLRYPPRTKRGAAVNRSAHLATRQAAGNHAEARRPSVRFYRHEGVTA